MDKKKDKKDMNEGINERQYGTYFGDPSEMRKAPGYRGSVPGVNTPAIDLPAFNPPVPNRAWTEMRLGKDIDELSEEEKRDLYIGNDNLF